MACIRQGKAAVELFTGDSAATYLYTFDYEPKMFKGVLAHALESTRSHRDLIRLEENRLNENPLYRMAVARNRYVSYLRTHLAGRIIHGSGWEERIKEFLAGS